MFLLIIIYTVFADYSTGGYLTTDLIEGTCDYSYSNSYIYDYQTLGGAQLNNLYVISFAFWIKYVTIDSNFQTGLTDYSYAFVLTDNSNSYDNRLFSFAITKSGPNTVIQLMQIANGLQGPTLQFNLNSTYTFDNTWNFVFVSYDFTFLKYNLGIFREGVVALNITQSCPNNLTFCSTTLLPQPFLQRPNLQLKVGLHAPFANSSFRGRTLCGKLSSFQYYTDIQMVSPENLFSLMYGYDTQGQYIDYRLLNFQGNIANDYGPNGIHGKITGSNTWSAQSLLISSPTQISIPGFQFSNRENRGRFIVKFWLYATDQVPFTLLQRAENSVNIFQIYMFWSNPNSNYLIRIITQLQTYDTVITFLPSSWNHFVFQYNYKSAIYNSQTMTIRCFVNNNAPVIVDTSINPFMSDSDSNQISIGVSEAILNTKFIQISNFQIHQGGRLLQHSTVDIANDGCYISVPKKYRHECLICLAGQYLMYTTTGNQCVTSATCATNNMVADTNRKICTPKCAPLCATCNIATPNICTACINNLVLSAGNCICSGTGYLGDPGYSMQCNAAQPIGETQIGEIDPQLSANVTTGTGARSEIHFIQFTSVFQLIPQVLLSIIKLQIQNGQQFQILATQINSQTFTLQINVWGTTIIQDIRILYLASSQSNYIKIQSLSVDTTQTLGLGSGVRNHIQPIYFSGWNLNYGTPRFLPFLIGYQQTGGTGNSTISYTYTTGTQIDFTMSTSGNNLISTVYWNYVLVQQAVEIVNIFNKQSTSYIQVSQQVASVDFTFNSSQYVFKNPTVRNFYGLGQISITPTTINFELREQQQNSTAFYMFMNAYAGTIIDSYGINVFSIVVPCQSMGCKTCTSSPITCSSCTDAARSIGSQCIDCSASQYLNASFICQPCSYFCTSCITSATNCISCPSGVNRINNATAQCPCISGYFDNQQAQCIACDWRCETCHIDSVTCLTCQGSNRLVEIQCKCAPQYFEQPSNIVCMNCIQPCDECTASGCTTCLENRIVDGSGACVCPPGGLAIPNTWSCETCDSSQMLSTLSNDTDSIFVEFVAGAVNFSSANYALLGDNELCKLILEKNQLPRYGDNPACSFNQTGFTIFLDSNAIVSIQEQLIFNPSIFVKSSCTSPIQNYYLTFLQQGTGSLPPDFTIDGPSMPIYICEPIMLKLTNLLNVGKRALITVTWSLNSTIEDQDLLASISQKLGDASTGASDSITFPELTFLNYSNYTFEVTAQSFIGLNTTKQFTLYTLGFAQPYIIASNTQIEYDYRTILIIPVTVYLKICSQGQILTYNENMTVSWQQLASTPNTSVPILSEIKNSIVKTQQQYLISGINSGTPDSTYIIQGGVTFNDSIIDPNQTADATTDNTTTPADNTTTPTDNTTTPADNTTTNTTTNSTDNSTNSTNTTNTTTTPPIKLKQIPIIVPVNFTVKVKYLGIAVIITGGDRVITEGQDAIFNALVWDGENLSPQIRIVWTCIKLIDKKPCQYKNGTDIELAENVTQNIINSEAFKLGQTYTLKVEAIADYRYSYKQINIICTTQNVYPLSVNYPLSIENRDVDIKQPMTFSFIPTDNIKNYNYSYNILYDGQSVSLQQLDYPKITITLKNILPQFLTTNYVTLQFIQKSPIIKQQSNIKVSFNMPPQNGEMSISPTQGIGGQTTFAITISGATDLDQPIQYRISMYLSTQHYQNDLQYGTNLYEMVLTQYSFNSTFYLRFSSGLNLTTQKTSSQIVVMATMMDSRGGKSNLTQQLTLSKTYNLWQQYALTLPDFTSYLRNVSNATDQIATLLETVMFYNGIIQANDNITTFLPIAQQQYNTLKTLSSTDVDINNTYNKINDLYAQSRINLDASANSYNLYQSQLKQLEFQINDTTKLLAQALSLQTDLELKGNLNILNAINLNHYQLQQQFQQYNSLQNFIINTTFLANVNESIISQTIKQWRIANPDEALQLDSELEQDESGDLTTYQRVQRYSKVKKIIQKKTSNNTILAANLTLDNVTAIQNYFSNALTQMGLFQYSLLQLLQLNYGSIQINGTQVGLSLQWNTFDKMMDKFIAQGQKFTNLSFINRRVLQTLNDQYTYYISIVQYKINPYMATDEFYNITGTYSFDTTFPLYQPFLYQVASNGSIQQITNISGANFSVDFIVPNSSLSDLYYYDCAQKHTNWNPNKSNCTRNIEYSGSSYAYKLWCTCPYFSETIALRPYEVEAAVLAPAITFGFKTFVDFNMGLVIIGTTGGFIFFFMLGFVLDKKDDTKRKVAEEELEQRKMDLLAYNRRRKGYQDLQDDHNGLKQQIEIEYSEISTQYEPQEITCHADLQLKDYSAKLFISGIIKLHEIISVLLYYDYFTLRTIRFLGIYMKLFVMMSICGFLLDKSNLLRSYLISLAFAELSTLLVKIVKAQLSGRGLQMAVGAIVSLIIIGFAIYDVFVTSFDQEQEPLDEWMQFYGACLAANFFVFDPILSILKVLLYPWCLKQIQTGQETPILYLIYFLIKQEDVIQFFKIEVEKEPEPEPEPEGDAKVHPEQEPQQDLQ